MEMNGKSRFIVASEYLMMLHQGIYSILIGAILPMMRVSCGLSYDVSGFIVSAMNIGQVAGGLAAGFLALKLGIKTSNVFAYILVTAGLLISLMTGSAIPLIIAFCLVGAGRGISSNYGNYLMNAVPANTSFLLNAFHTCFAAGAVIAPLIVMACTSRSSSNWKTPLFIVTIYAAAVAVCFIFQDLKDIAPMTGSRANRSLAFLKEKIFVMIVLIMFCYQAIECTILGWMTSYYVDTKIVSEASSQLFTSILWGAVLAGRLIFTVISRKLRSKAIIKYLSVLVLISLILLLLSRSYAMLLISTICIGLALSGMYANIVASAGTLFLDYALSMSVYFTIICLGGTIWPIIVGFMAEHFNIRTGIGTLIVPAAAMLILCIIFDRGHCKDSPAACSD